MAKIQVSISMQYELAERYRTAARYNDINLSDWVRAAMQEFGDLTPEKIAYIRQVKSGGDNRPFAEWKAAQEAMGREYR